MGDRVFRVVVAVCFRGYMPTCGISAREISQVDPHPGSSRSPRFLVGVSEWFFLRMRLTPVCFNSAEVVPLLTCPKLVFLPFGFPRWSIFTRGPKG